MTEKQIKTNLLNVDVWIRLAYMALFALLIVVARIIILVVAVLQFLLVLITGRDNDNLRDLGQGVSKWVYQGLLFLTFNTDEKPWPFSDWPDLEQTESYVAPQREVKEPSEDREPESHASGETVVAAPDNDVPSFTADTEGDTETEGDVDSNDESTAEGEGETDDSSKHGNKHSD